MNNFKKYLLILLSITILVSCSKDPTENMSKVRITAYLDTIIQDWEGQKEFIKEFNRLTETDLTIVQPPHQQYMDKLIVSFSEPNAPDVCEILPEYLSLFISNKSIIDLNPFIKNSSYIKSFNEEFLESYRTSSGELYGFPTRDGGAVLPILEKTG
ncbi:extracellular solute-binding protein [Thiospirochaeta perfilievii]|uniref:Extracellular solute-binding protein n=1 Tax=Thiospirochaeta perfilievii TaxID=252967 RepID=A0A5C1QCC9_9SPIO|nr:extracellular solute-binding protein [Thiospirochaeta perfilievii]QEN04324.1 extracellular solute-binding protein [Thiospirochaeta perfilievii]